MLHDLPSDKNPRLLGCASWRELGVLFPDVGGVSRVIVTYEIGAMHLKKGRGGQHLNRTLTYRSSNTSIPATSPTIMHRPQFS